MSSLLNQNGEFKLCTCHPSVNRRTNNTTNNCRDGNCKHAKICAKQALNDLLRNSSIHGLQYLLAKNMWEKIFWIIMITVSIYFSSILIQKTYKIWQENPVIVSFSEKSTPVWHIPFPAVTICSETKTVKDIISFTQIYRKLLQSSENSENNTIKFTNQTSSNHKEFEYLQTLLQICSTHLVDNIQFNHHHQDSVDYFTILDEIVPEFQRTYPTCNWKNNLSSCDSLFSKTYTEQGICYTFNGLNPLELYREQSFQFQQFKDIYNDSERMLNWSLETGYTASNSNPKQNVYPDRVLGAGIRAGLFMTVQGFEQNLDYICRGPVQGFKVVLHSPDDFPHVSKNFFRVPYRKEVLVSVSPHIMTTSESLRSYSSNRRQCFFGEERRLSYFQIYTQGNCEVECLANYTLTKCGCVQFSMPRFVETPACDVSKIRCIFDAEHELRKRKFESEFIEGLENLMDCNCLPACTSLVYHTEISQAEFDMESLLMAYNDTEYIENNPGFKMSRILIFFKENQYIALKRSELNGITDFIANCGGIFGLFMGVSVLSVVDFFYYFLQFIYNVYSKVLPPPPPQRAAPTATNSPQFLNCIGDRQQQQTANF